ncbi:DoxX family protein [Streptococcus uberis]|uniref:DoxX family protein n=1 Tax=Streptococcus uberis TaxID=1349 RepID=UPI0012B62047|nr:DoxX family protein [Streptococcus uberis]MCR4257332.1 DoxX family protein [Streptococcus uberis]MTB42218.1 DoxX family membrane protein [Streptococcus uberis]MTB70109.1 DoxX family membrane protein [Streptococcus uberis]MTC90917.1 DoxX family membrane protein [Streptococcus uberis]MTC95686.1 DoxX family membrane protein [Streptococcus uberis]
MQKHIDNFTPYALGLLRIVTGYMMIFHGLDKVFGTFSGKAVPLTSLIGVGGIIELVFGFLVLIGLATRLVAFILSGQMAVAYFMFHGLAGNVFFPYVNKGELAALYAFVFFLFVFTGSGALGIDSFIAKKKD